MPIYEYLCESCGKVNERLQKVNDPPPPRCDECGGRKLAKLVSRSAFQLKGGGWYSDLYASRKKEAPAGDAGTSASGSAGGAPPASPASGAADAAKPASAAAKASTEKPAGAGRSGKARGAGKGG
ncbi:MAG TPA: zinc ribbon domain-containing protein [Anaeromyxobacteraceae bacterium]|nr:zinc ribbon domain-containing protein [Anaeromyxobacteraceae bacterium]